MIEVKVQMPDPASVNVEGAVVKVPVYPSGEIDIDHNGEWNVAAYSTANVAVPTTAVLEETAKSYTPTESVQTESITPSTGYDGLSKVDVTVGAIPSDYVGSGVTRKTSADLTQNGATVTAPAGYYEEAASSTIPDAVPFLSIENGEFFERDGEWWYREQPFIEIDSEAGDTPGYLADGSHISGEYVERHAIPANTTITPTASTQTIGVPNTILQYGITIAAVPPWNWVGNGVEKLSNCYSESTTLKAVGFDSWTATTTASTLRNGQAGTDISADMANYDYIIKWKCYWEAAYNAGATYYAIPVNGATEFYQILCRRPQTLSDVQSENYNQNTYAAFYTMNYQEYYNTSGIHVAAWSNAYGITFTVNAPTYSGGDTITISPLCPSIGARCNGSYFNTARKADIDSEHSTIKIIGEVYRVSKSALRSTYESMVDIANHGL